MLTVGNTPLIKLNKIPGERCAQIYVKFEGANPTGSMKDRMALSMIQGAEKRGELKKGGTVIEYTGGSTGSSLAMICAIKGYKAHFISSDAFAEEKIQLMRAFGAEVELIESDNGKITAKLIDAMVKKAKELSEKPNSFLTDQFNNSDNKKAYHTMADEILKDVGTSINEFIMGVGTGGCFSGNSERLKEKVKGIKCIATEPFYVRALSKGDTSGTHRLEGMGAGFVPTICRLDLADEIIAVKDEDAYEMARRLATEEGILGGITSGANVWAALERAKRLGPEKKVVTVICDSGLKYMQGDLYK